MNKEIWKPIENYENYEISNFGKIRKKDKILKQYKNCKGYLYSSLSKNNKRKSFRTHRLVAQAFISNPDNLPEINHKNEIKTDNRAENLEWCNHTYNINYGGGKEKASMSRYKKVIQYDLDHNFIKIWSSLKEVKKKYKNIHLWEALNGRRNTANEYIWEYFE